MSSDVNITLIGCTSSINSAIYSGTVSEMDDWAAEFQVVTIPHALEYIQQTAAQKKLKSINNKFNTVYPSPTAEKRVTIRFCDDVTVIEYTIKE